jgi:hypothetical protein
MQAYLKVRGHVLMTKFGKPEKTRSFGSWFQTIQFWQFQS